MRRAASPAFLVAAMALAALAAMALDVGSQEPTEAERLYRARRFGEAYAAYRAMVERDRNSRAVPALDYNSGNALYRLGRYDEAARRFRDALAGSPELRQKSYYNMGTTLLKASETAVPKAKGGILRQAVAAYERALLIDPRDSVAKWNLELTLRQLEEERLQGMPMRREGPGASAGNDNQGGAQTVGSAAPGVGAGATSGEGDQPQQIKPVRELTASQARELLRTIQREQRRPVQQSEGSAGRRGKKDW